MKKPYEIIKELESNNSRLFKESVILREMKMGNDAFFEGANLACDKLKTFGVKKVPISKNLNGNTNWEKFKVFLNNLMNRNITGNNAKEHINNFIKTTNMDEWNYFYRRILIKDLRCGVSEKTINNVAKKNNFEKYRIAVFNCQLAQDSELHQKKLVGKKIIEVKLDGVRVITILYKSGNVVMFSRNGKELNNFDHIADQFKETIKKNPLSESLVIDGEIVSKNFQELMKQIYRKDSVQNSDAILYVFDFLTLRDFQSGISNVKQLDRISMLSKWFELNKLDLKNLKLMSREFIDLETTDGKNIFKNFNNCAVEKGYEGIMIKDPNAYYECKRSTSWLKSKPVIEVSLKVKSIEEGTGRNAGKLGAISVEGEDNNKFFQLSVGSGFSDKQRIEFWERKKDLIGQIIEVKADAITKSQDGEFWSLRFPRFKTFRGFKKSEKL